MVELPPQFNQWLSHLSPNNLNIQETLNRKLERQVKLAVTGLSRSGKTVFIASLIHQLLHSSTSSNLPFFKLIAQNRLQGVKLMPQPDMHIPAFRYEQAIEQFTHQPPNWPTPTSGISEIRLAIRYKTANLFRRQLGDTSTLYIDIIDYPGEWLLDLPLLELEYEQWSAYIANLCEKEPRFSLSQPWREFMQNINIHAETSDSVLRQASELYTQFLEKCKQRYHFSLLQPGRFIMPGDLKGAPLLEFCPILQLPETIPKKGSFFHTMKKRYQSYKEHVVKKFYVEHFASFDRQIVLTDVLSAFNSGYQTFIDMQEALDLILNSFEYGKTGFFNRLFGLKIDKLLFAATKADHVTPNQLSNLERFLQQMLAGGYHNALFEGGKVATMALAAVKCTQTAQASFQGQQISCLKGIPLDGEQAIALFPGEVPLNIPPEDEWTADRFNFVAFKPPRLTHVHEKLPHIRLDYALEFLIGDKFV